ELRSDVDDAAAATLTDHLLRCRLAEMKHARQVDCDDPLPLGGIEVEKVPAMTDPGAVEQHIEPAELAHRSRYCLGNRRSVAHVECDCDCPSAGGADPYGHSFGRSSVEICAGDCGALARQPFSTGSAHR